MKKVNLQLRRDGYVYKYDTILDRKDGRIWFPDSNFDLKDTIKSMGGSRWDADQRAWSIADSPRNHFQLNYLMGNNPYALWDKPLKKHRYNRPLRGFQCELSDHALTYHYCIWAAEMGLGKTLAAIEVIEKSERGTWWWVGPKSALAAVELEFEKWGLKVPVHMLTYAGLTKLMNTWTPGEPAPHGVVFDESSRLKTVTSQRTIAAQALADAIREEHKGDGYVVLMSGTPSPKSPVDWWSQCEVAFPGFVREGSTKAFEFRMGLFEKRKKIDGFYWDRITWLDDERKCGTCGGYESEVAEALLTERKAARPEEQHKLPPVCKCERHVPSFNEVAYMDKRLQGLVIKFLKKDCLDLPEKQYREIFCEPSRTIKRVAETMVEIAPTAIQGLTWLRELSDGFQYVDKRVGDKQCHCVPGVSGLGPASEADPECEICKGSGEIPEMQRQCRQIPCPKDKVVKELLAECEDHGRMIIFAGFTGSIDRLRVLCLEQKWDVVQVDGRGWKIFGNNLEKDYIRSTKPLSHWSGDAPRVVFIAHPQSGGMGLTLTESRMSVFYSNDFNPESRSQAEDRHHRMGMDDNLGGIIVDIYHLPTDQYVRNILKANRRLELLTLGEVQASL